MELPDYCIQQQLYVIKYQQIPTQITLGQSSSSYLIDDQETQIFILSSNTSENVNVICPEEEQQFLLNAIPDIICKKPEQKTIDIKFVTTNKLPEKTICMLTKLNGIQSEKCNAIQQSEFSIQLDKNNSFIYTFVIKSQQSEEFPFIQQYREDYSETQINGFQFFIDDVQVMQINDFYLPQDVIHIIGQLQFDVETRVQKFEDKRCSYFGYTYNFDQLICNQNITQTIFQPNQQGLIVLVPDVTEEINMYANQTFLIHTQQNILLYTNSHQDENIEVEEEYCYNQLDEQQVYRPQIKRNQDNCIFYLWFKDENQLIQCTKTDEQKDIINEQYDSYCNW